MEDGLGRPDLLVVARVLEALARHDGPMRPTRLQQAAGTNYSQFERYLAFLVGRGLVTVTEPAPGERWIALTARGFDADRYLVEALARVLGPGDGR